MGISDNEAFLARIDTNYYLQIKPILLYDAPKLAIRIEHAHRAVIAVKIESQLLPECVYCVVWSCTMPVKIAMHWSRLKTPSSRPIFFCRN